ncbi:MAG TPA: DUF1801 domain-containing protein [Pyrinomonadaceae bacterium]|nr:DUF1801 domain-containing protein [Pyrinomonadaceae bacterium]
MAKAKLQTQETDASVDDFIAAIENPVRRADAEKVLAMYKRVTGEEPKMWGPAIVGFGNGVLRYPDGREIDWMLAAFSPRKQNMTLYVISDSPKQPALLAKLGKHTTSVACLYIKKLSDVDEKVLEAIVKDAYTYDAKKSK